MSISVFSRSIEKVFASGLVGEKLSVVWHAGEPLALPLSFYEEAFQSITALGIPPEKVEHSMQTNGMLINDRWCAFIKDHAVKLGVSIDGPASVHDAHRKTRGGKGTHAQVMKGVEILRQREIDFHAIAVITEQSLDHPDEIFNFFLENGIRRVGFNVEEIEGANSASTLSPQDAGHRVRDFLRRIFYLQKSARGAVKIREFDGAYQAIAQCGLGSRKQNDQAAPFGIISVAYDGSFSTFSPELLGMRSPTYGDFYFGHVLTDDILDATQTDKFKRVLRDIQAGVSLCAESCEYFSLCGGGAPSNKYYENGSFASAETMFCRHTIKTPLDIVLTDLEEALGVRSEALGESQALTL